MGIDFAPTAVARTRALGVAAQVAMFSGFSHEPFDLVSVHYGGIRATSEEVEKLEHLVAPGGTLLFVHHDMESTELAMPEWLAHNLRELETVTLARRERHLAEGAGAHNLRELETVTLARRERHLAESAGAHHRTDVVLVAKRVG